MEKNDRIQIKENYPIHEACKTNNIEVKCMLPHVDVNTIQN